MDANSIKSNGGLPKEIQHPFHPQHPLTLYDAEQYRQHSCDACGKSDFRQLYRCSDCDFDLDVHCACLMPSSDKNDEHPDEGHVDGHGHPLIHCGKPKITSPLLSVYCTSERLTLSCSACVLPWGDDDDDDDDVYVCLSCSVVLHKSCAHLPRKLEHPFHPSHPLSLLDTVLSELELRVCRACCEMIEGFAYRCPDCEVDFHTRCLFPLPAIMNSDMHKHPLAFRKDYPLHWWTCKTCQMEPRGEFQHPRCNYGQLAAEPPRWCSARIPLFACVECHFSVHLQCLSELPPAVKHKCHLHPLTLTRSPIKDHEDEDEHAEFYCDACEEHRELYETTYYCAECHYVAHVHCVISEIWPYLERIWLSLNEKREKMKLDMAADAGIDELVAEIGAVQKRVHELNAQLALETLKLDGLKERLEKKKLQYSEAHVDVHSPMPT